MTGATGAIYGIRALEALRAAGVPTHLVISRWAETTIVAETSWKPAEVRGLADRVYEEAELDAPPASAGFRSGGMIVAPCSMKTLAAIALGHNEDLLHRAADVVLKERRRLVLCVRETPFNEIHLEHMLKLTRMGVVIAPPLPAFYDSPKNLDDVVNHSVSRVLDLFDIHLDVARRWDGVMGIGGERPLAARRSRARSSR